MMYLDMKWAEMSKRSLAGQTERMLPYYEKMKPQMKHNPLFLYNYAAELNYIGRYEESLVITEECMNHTTTTMFSFCLQTILQILII